MTAATGLPEGCPEVVWHNRFGFWEADPRGSKIDPENESVPLELHVPGTRARLRELEAACAPLVRFLEARESMGWSQVAPEIMTLMAKEGRADITWDDIRRIRRALSGKEAT